MIHSTVSAPKGEKTKYRLAESMKECMKTTPVEEITVRQICEICGVTRQTFYRNFLDKYDLINWYFDKLLTKSFEHMGAYRHGSDTFRVCRSSRPGNAGRLKKTVPESAAALLERVSKWDLQIAEMVFQTRSGYFSQILFCCFCHNGDFF